MANWFISSFRMSRYNFEQALRVTWDVERRTNADNRCTGRGVESFKNALFGSPPPSRLDHGKSIPKRQPAGRSNHIQVCTSKGSVPAASCATSSIATHRALELAPGCLDFNIRQMHRRGKPRLLDMTLASAERPVLGTICMPRPEGP